MRRRSLIAGLGAGLASPAFAQAEYPARPVRVVVPFPPGGSNDAIARPLTDAMSRALGQPFVIENRGGAGSTIGTAEVVRAPADGYAVLVTSSTFATSAAVQQTPYDAGRDLETVALLATAPLCMLSSPGFAPNTMGEAIAFIRAHPGEVHYGSSGPGSIGHMAGALFALRGRLDMQHVPYRGTGPVLNDMVANTIELTFTTITAAAGLVSSGRVKLLGWTTESPPASGPAGPTPAQSGLPDYEASIWWGLLARRGIPPAAAARLHTAAQAALTEGRFATNLAQEGAAASHLSQADSERFIQADLTRWRDLALSANIRVE
ncbi:MAG: Tripartite-type tricarboxylate transporter, receptor component TctC [Rubritepida sp.]|nr:Tripartite-type tricarboxylate transporter, receptor component TctC [Rubritepida sp.]